MFLNIEVFKDAPHLEKQNLVAALLVTALMVALFPFLALVLIVADVFRPQHPITAISRSPNLKLLSHLASYIVFLGLLVASAKQPDKYFLIMDQVGEYANCGCLWSRVVVGTWSACGRYVVGS